MFQEIAWLTAFQGKVIVISTVGVSAGPDMKVPTVNTRLMCAQQGIMNVNRFVSVCQEKGIFADAILVIFLILRVQTAVYRSDVNHLAK